MKMSDIVSWLSDTLLPHVVGIMMSCGLQGQCGVDWWTGRSCKEESFRKQSPFATRETRLDYITATKKKSITQNINICKFHRVHKCFAFIWLHYVYIFGYNYIININMLLLRSRHVCHVVGSLLFYYLKTRFSTFFNSRGIRQPCQCILEWVLHDTREPFLQGPSLALYRVSRAGPTV